MKSSGGVWKHGSELGAHVWCERQGWQWQPTTTAHDPSPPITLEDAAGGSPTTLTPDAVLVVLGLPAPTALRVRAVAPSAILVPISAPTPAFAGLTTTDCEEATYGADVRDDGNKGHLDGDDFAGIDGSSRVWRWALKFPVSGIAGTVLKVELVVTVAVVVGAPTTWDVGPYGTNGQDDPNADSGATMFSRCANAGEYANDTSVFASTGSKTIDLGAQAVTDLQAALAGGIFSVSCRYNGAGTGVGAALQEYDPLGTTAGEPELCVTYAPDASVTLTPSAVAVPISAVAPTVALALTATPTQATVPIVAPAPTVALILTATPAAVAVLITPAAPTALRTRAATPDPVQVPLVAPAPVVIVAGGPTTLSPDSIAVPVVPVAPTVALALAVSPDPVAVPVSVPTPTALVEGAATTLTPSAAAVSIAVQAPTVVVQSDAQPSPTPGGGGGGGGIAPPRRKRRRRDVLEHPQAELRARREPPRALEDELREGRRLRAAAEAAGREAEVRAAAAARQAELRAAAAREAAARARLEMLERLQRQNVELLFLLDVL